MGDVEARRNDRDDGRTAVSALEFTTGHARAVQSEGDMVFVACQVEGVVDEIGGAIR